MSNFVVIDNEKLKDSLSEILNNWQEGSSETYEDFEDALAENDLEKALKISYNNLNELGFSILAAWIQDEYGDLKSFDKELLKKIDPVIWCEGKSISVEPYILNNFNNLFEDLGRPYINNTQNLTIQNDDSYISQYEIKGFDPVELTLNSTIPLKDIATSKTNKVIIENVNIKILDIFKDMQENKTVTEIDLRKAENLKLINLDHFINFKALKTIYLPDKINSEIKEGESKPSLGIFFSDTSILNNLTIYKNKTYSIRVKSKYAKDLAAVVKNI